MAVSAMCALCGAGYQSHLGFLARAPPTMASDTWTNGRGKPPPRLLFLVAFHPSGDSNVEEDKTIQASQFDSSSFNFMFRTSETIIMLN